VCPFIKLISPRLIETAAYKLPNSDETYMTSGTIGVRIQRALMASRGLFKSEPNGVVWLDSCRLNAGGSSEHQTPVDHRSNETMPVHSHRKRTKASQHGQILGAFSYPSSLQSLDPRPPTRDAARQTLPTLKQRAKAGVCSARE
jgi:hypothetical protein